MIDSDTQAWRDRAKTFADEHIRTAGLLQREWVPDYSERMPWDIIAAGSRAGFRTVAVPAAFGGPNPPLSPLAAAFIIEEFAAADPGVASVFNHVIKEVRLIERLANEEQKKEFYEEYMKDESFITGTAMTEPEHGGDRLTKPEGFSYETTAVLDGDEWVINGRKHCITNGNEAKLLLVHAKTDPNADYTNGTSMFLVRRDSPGLKQGATHDKIGLRMVNNTEVVFDNCRIHKRYLLGEINKGVTQVGSFMRDNDLLSLAMKLGIARSAYETALNFARERVQGGKPIVEHQAVGLKLAEMLAHVQTIRAQIFRLADMIRHPEEYEPMFNELATWHSVETVFRVATLCVQVCGCHGIWRDHLAQKHLRDALVYFPNDGNHTNQLLAVHNQLVRQSG